MSKMPESLRKLPLFTRLRLFWIGFSMRPAWVHCNGESSHSSVMLAAFHHPVSITWRWAIYWNVPWKLKAQRFSFKRWASDYGWFEIQAPFLGSIRFNWQPHVWSIP